MPIKNLTTKKFLANKFRVASSSIEKALGLMFSEPKDALVMVFDKEQRVALHMCFVPVSIDVLFLNSRLEVVDIKRGFRPFTFYTSKKKAKCVIELQEGAVRKSGTNLHDKIGLFTVSVEKDNNSRRIRIK